MTSRLFAMGVLLAIFVLVASAGRSPAVAEIGQPMTFRLFAANGPRGPAIDADGDFVANTPARFEAFLAANGITSTLPPPLRPTVFFTSGGGSVRAGIALGTIIRSLNLDTSVGSHAPVPAELRSLLAARVGIIVNEDCARSSVFQLPNSCRLDRDAGLHASYCVSSCTIAFLGGVNRSMVEGSQYAVHQYRFDCDTPQTVELCTDGRKATATAQELSADLSAYLEAMEIPAGFLHDMVLADPQHVNVLSTITLLKYRILGSDFMTKWDVKRSTGGLALVYEEHRHGENSSVVFDCAKRGSNAELTLQIVGDHYGDLIKALAPRAIQFQYLPQARPSEWQEFTLLTDEIVRPPYAEQGGGVGLVLRATPRILDALHMAVSFWVMSNPPPGLAGIPPTVSYASVSLDKDKVEGYIAGCR